MVMVSAVAWSTFRSFMLMLLLPFATTVTIVALAIRQADYIADEMAKNNI